MIISLINQKGGVGKTTAAINLGAGLVRRNHQLLFVDADPQGSASQWRSIEDNHSFELLRIDSMDIHIHDLLTLGDNYDFVIIDTPPAIGAIAGSVLAISDLAIVPLSPSPLDIWSCWGTLDLINQSHRSNPGLQARLLINRKVAGTRVGRDFRETLATFNIDVFRTELHQRIAFVESMISGVSVLQFEPNGKAAREIEALCDEVLSQIRIAEPEMEHALAAELS